MRIEFVPLEVSSSLVGLAAKPPTVILPKRGFWRACRNLGA